MVSAHAAATKVDAISDAPTDIVGLLMASPFDGAHRACEPMTVARGTRFSLGSRLPKVQCILPPGVNAGVRSRTWTQEKRLDRAGESALIPVNGNIAQREACLRARTWMLRAPRGPSPDRPAIDQRRAGGRSAMWRMRTLADPSRGVSLTRSCSTDPDAGQTSGTEMPAAVTSSLDTA